MVIVISVLLLANIAVFAFKVVLEIGMGISKITNFLEICNLFVLVVALLCKLANIALTRRDLTEPDNFEALSVYQVSS